VNQEIPTLSTQRCTNEDAQSDGSGDMRPSGIIKHYIFTLFHIHVYIYLHTSGSFWICTW